ARKVRVIAAKDVARRVLALTAVGTKAVTTAVIAIGVTRTAPRAIVSKPERPRTSGGRPLIPTFAMTSGIGLPIPRRRVALVRERLASKAKSRAAVIGRPAVSAGMASS